MNASDTLTPVITPIKQKGEPKTARITLAAGGTRLTLMAVRKKDGTATTFATTTDTATKKTTRGMTEKHANFDAAKGAIAAQAAKAEKIGWQRKERSGGFVAKPDAFIALPTPPAATAKAKKGGRS
jgi:hypothetical protein